MNTKGMKFDETLRAVGGEEGITRCLQAGNDAPLKLVLMAAGEEIRALKERVEDLTELAALGG